MRKVVLEVSQKVGAFLACPTRAHVQVALFTFGVALVALGTIGGASAQHEIEYNDTRLADSVNAILTYLEGSFGALIMVCAGLGAILSSAFGQYRAALGCLIIAVGAFILRSFLSTFFNDENIQE